MTDAAPRTDAAQPQIDPLRPWPDTVAWRAVSPRLIVVEQLRLAATLAVVVGIGLILWTSFDSRSALLVSLGALGLGALRSVLIVRSVRSWGYAEREDDLLVRHGLLVRHLSIVPYARMQFVDVSAGPLERMFGLATVDLHTAAAASDASIPGLVGAEAARLRDRLSALGETRAEGL